MSTFWSFQPKQEKEKHFFLFLFLPRKRLFSLSTILKI